MANKELAKLFGLPEDADDAAILAKAKERDEGYAKLAGQVTELAKKDATREATEKVEAAIRARKIPPAQKPFWVEFAREKPEDFTKHVDGLPVMFSGPAGSDADTPEMSATEQLSKLANVRVAEAAKGGSKLSSTEALKQINREQPDLVRQSLAERRANAPRVASAS